MSKANTISRLSRLLSNKEASAVELAKQHLERAQEIASKTNAYISIDPEETLSQAKKADKKIKEGSAGVLCGIPYSLKDVYSTKNIQTTCASDVLKGYVPQYNAEVYDRLLAEGAVLIGKNNQDSWGHGGSSENTDYGPVKNPWDLSRVAGGSSGGTAACVSANASTFGIAEDTGGSIRNPASFCNLTGLKVTYGRVSRYGAIAYASSFDTMGPLAKNSEDCAIILEHIAGFDSKDASSSRVEVPQYSKSLNSSISGKVIGVPKEFFDEGLNSEVKNSIENALKELVEQGAKIEEISLPTVKYGHAIYYVLTFAETSSNLARYDQVRFGAQRELFTRETKRRIMTGTFGLSSGYYDAYYKKAMQARTVLINEFNEAFKKVDVIVSPVMPFPAYPIGDIASQFDKSELELAMYLADMYTVLANTVGIPAISIPTGFSEKKLPLSMQLHGPMFSEGLLLNIAHQYQQVTNWHKEEPNL